MIEEEFLRTILKAFREFYNYAGLHDIRIETNQQSKLWNKEGIDTTTINFDFIDPEHGLHKQELKLLRAMNLETLEKVLKEEEYNARSTNQSR